MKDAYTFTNITEKLAKYVAVLFEYGGRVGHASKTIMDTKDPKIELIIDPEVE